VLSVSKKRQIEGGVKFALFCKSFRDDLGRFLRLAESVERHNTGRLPFYASVPRADRRLFSDALRSQSVELLSDEDVIGDAVMQSWTSQQLVKLHVWRTGFADAWFWVDSDAYFFRDFALEDFVRSDGSVAFAVSRKLHVLEERWDDFADGATPAHLPLAPAELGRPPIAFVGSVPPWRRWLDALVRRPYEARLPRIASFFGRSGPPLYYLPGAVWTKTSLASFEEQVLAPLRATFADLLRYAPWEANWIGEWVISTGMRGRHIVESPFLHIRSDDAILRARREGLGETRLAKRYLGVQLAARHQCFERLDEPEASQVTSDCRGRRRASSE
jgi:Family of unknown function (DUF6492)